MKENMCRLTKHLEKKTGHTGGLQDIGSLVSTVIIEIEDQRDLLDCSAGVKTLQGDSPCLTFGWTNQHGRVSGSSLLKTLSWSVASFVSRPVIVYLVVWLGDIVMRNVLCGWPQIFLFPNCKLICSPIYGCVHHSM